MYTIIDHGCRVLLLSSTERGQKRLYAYIDIYGCGISTPKDEMTVLKNIILLYCMTSGNTTAFSACNRIFGKRLQAFFNVDIRYIIVACGRWLEVEVAEFLHIVLSVRRSNAIYYYNINGRGWHIARGPSEDTTRSGPPPTVWGDFCDIVIRSRSSTDNSDDICTKIILFSSKRPVAHAWPQGISVVVAA